ncbi:MAG: putative protein YpfJ [Burkholderia sp.]|jgi:uncharacterized protein
MKWKDLEGSSNVEDRRGQSGGFGYGAPRRRSGFGGIPLRGKTGVIIVLIVLIAGFYGVDLTPLITGDFSGTSGTTSSVQSSYTETAQDKELAKFTSVALRTTEEVWGELFKAEGKTYSDPTLVLYSGVTQTACGLGQSAMGPFYCPADRKLYIDLSFYRDMQKKYGGGGDFALGYVLAHEVGHHVQTLQGISESTQRRQSQSSKVEANRLQVKMELQADCYAGVWGYYVNKAGILETGDLQEALSTASAIGDDRLQKEATGRVVPDSFTHGTSEQRYYWFKKGFDSGNPKACNTWASVK